VPGYHFLVDLDHLRDVVRTELVDALRAALPPLVQRLRSKEVLTQKEVMELTGWTARQLAYRRTRGDIPFIKRGRTIWYKAADVYSWLDAGYVPGTRVR
jgi:hypothetical protein